MDDLIDILEHWQRGELSGHAARQRTGTRSYGDLYKLARRYNVEVRVLPRGLISRADVDAADFLGSTLDNWLALKVALTASDDPES